MEVGGTLTAWLLPLLCLLSAIAIEWKWKYPHVHVSDFFRADPFNLGFVACGLAIIVIPLKESGPSLLSYAIIEGPLTPLGVGHAQ